MPLNNDSFICTVDDKVNVESNGMRMEGDATHAVTVELKKYPPTCGEVLLSRGRISSCLSV